MRIEREVERLKIGHPSDMAKAARGLGHELPRKRVDVLRSFRAQVAQLAVGPTEYALGYRHALLEVTAAFEVAVEAVAEDSLKTTKEMVTWADVSELRHLIEDTFDVDYDIRDNEDLGPQGAWMVFKVSQTKAADYARTRLEEWKAGADHTNVLYLILNELCRRKKIETGIVLMYPE